jgi:hypothetical protein
MLVVVTLIVDLHDHVEDYGVVVIHHHMEI